MPQCVLILRPVIILPLLRQCPGLFKAFRMEQTVGQTDCLVSPVQLPILVQPRGQPRVLGVSLGSIQQSRLKVNARTVQRGIHHLADAIGAACARLAPTVTPWVRRRAQIVQRPVQFHIFPVQIWMTVGVDRGMKRDTMTNVMYVVWVAFPVNQVQHANNVP